LLTAALRFSISSPRLPIMIPGLEVWIVTTKFSALLSNSILLIEECLSLFEKNSLTLRSCIRLSLNALPLAYQLAFCFFDNS